MTLATRRTVLSILILSGLMLEMLARSLFHLGPPWNLIWISVGLCMVGIAATLWVKGLRQAGRGWRRRVFLMAFAGPMVWMGLSLADFARGFYDGFTYGYQEGAALAVRDRAAEGLPPKPVRSLPVNPIPEGNPKTQILSWMALTILLAMVLDRMERRSAEAERQAGLLKEARYQAMGARLAPHFIFNTLNTLHAQIGADPKGAEGTTEKLAALFRQAIEVAERATVPLRLELTFIEAYLGIEQARLGERLRVRVEVPEALEPIEIPPMSLQVLVENAIKHGVAPLEQGGEVHIGAAQRDGALHLWVEDPGTGISPLKGTGTALETLRQRLERPEDLVMGMVDGRHRVSFKWRQG